jgi:hypothetical protein
MEFLSRLNLSETDRIIPNPSNLIFEIGDIQVYATNGQSTLYHDVCGFLFKDSDIIVKTGKTKQKHEPASRDDIRSAIVKMHSSIPLTPTEESASLLYKTLSGCKKKKSRGKRDEEEELDEDDDEEVLRIVRKKDLVKVPIASTKKSASSFSGSVAAKTNALKEDSDDEEIEEDGLEDDEEEDEEELKEEEEEEEEEQDEQE